MEPFTAIQIIAGLLAALGGATGIVAMLTFIAARRDKRKDELASLRQLEITNSVEMRRLEQEAAKINDESIKRAIWDLLAATRTELAEKKIEIIELQNLQSLSRPIVARIRESMRAIRRQMSVIDDLVCDLPDNTDLQIETEILREKIDDLEAALR